MRSSPQPPFVPRNLGVSRLGTLGESHKPRSILGSTVHMTNSSGLSQLHKPGSRQKTLRTRRHSLIDDSSNRYARRSRAVHPIEVALKIVFHAKHRPPLRPIHRAIIRVPRRDVSPARSASLQRERQCSGYTFCCDVARERPCGILAECISDHFTEPSCRRADLTRLTSSVGFGFEPWPRSTTTRKSLSGRNFWRAV